MRDAGTGSPPLLPQVQQTHRNACDCSIRSGRPAWQVKLPLFPAAVLLMLPKCPLCILMWCGLTGSVCAPWVKAVWGLPLDVLLLSSSVLALAVAFRRRGDRYAIFAGS